MIERSRYDSDEMTFLDRKTYQNGNVTKHELRDSIYYPRTEKIEYEAGPKRAIKYCKHSKYTTENRMLSGGYIRTGTTTSWTWKMRFTGLNPLEWGPIEPDHIDWSGAMSTLYRNALGINEQGVQLAVGIAEAKQLATIIPSMLKSFKQLPRAFRSKHSLKSVADGYLAQQFGLMPFIGELKGAMDAIQAIASHVRHIQKRKGKWVTLTSQARVSELNDDFDCPSEESMPTWFSGYLERLQTSGSEARISCKAYTPPLSDEAIVARAILNYFGLSNPLTVAWELVPFSFVVDWFVPVGNYLADNKWLQHNAMKTVSGVQFHRACHSLKHQSLRQWAAHYRHGSEYSPSVEGPYPAARTVRGEHYQRWKGFPSDGTIPQGWSLRQTLLSTALVVQRL